MGSYKVLAHFLKTTNIFTLISYNILIDLSFIRTLRYK